MLSDNISFTELSFLLLSCRFFRESKEYSRKKTQQHTKLVKFYIFFPFLHSKTPRRKEEQFFFLLSTYIFMLFSDEPVALQQYMSEHDLKSVTLIFVSTQRLFTLEKNSIFIFSGAKKIRWKNFWKKKEKFFSDFFFVFFFTLICCEIFFLKKNKKSFSFFASFFLSALYFFFFGLWFIDFTSQVSLGFFSFSFHLFYIIFVREIK